MPWHAGGRLGGSASVGDSLLLRQEVYGAENSPKKATQKFTSTARAAGQEILTHRMASPRSLSRMRAENKIKRRELAGTQWEFGTSSDLADWQKTVREGTVLNSGMRTAHRLNTSNGEATARLVSAAAKTRARRVAMESGAAVRFDGETGDPGGIYGQDHKTYATLQEARAGDPDNAWDTRAMVQKCKYASHELWPSAYDKSDFETDEKRRQRTLANACGSPEAMLKERVDLAASGREKKKAFQRGQIDCLRFQPGQRSADGYYNRRTNDFALPEGGQRASQSDQKKINLERKRALSGTQWQFGLTDTWQTDFKTTMHKDISSGVTGDCLTELVAAKGRARALKARLTKTTIELGGDTWG